jgi:hypothetical protein
MDANLDKIAKDLYGKIQTRFRNIKIGDENAEVLSKKEDIPRARFFEFEYEEGDAVYMVSDGFVDQIGGPEQKKFSTKRLKGLIAENAHEDMKTQKALFNIVWKDWKGDDEQLDDVTMIGIKFH